MPILTLSLLSTLSAPGVSNPPPTPPEPPAIARMLPAETPLVSCISTKAADWSLLRRFQLFQSAATAIAGLMPPTAKFDYAKDVEPWLGDQIVLAMLPQRSDDEPATIDTHFLMMAAIRDQTRLQPLLNLFKAGRSQQITERDYKGVTIWEWKAVDPTVPMTTLPVTSPMAFVPTQLVPTSLMAATPSRSATPYIPPAPSETLPPPPKVVLPPPKNIPLPRRRIPLPPADEAVPAVPMPLPNAPKPVQPRKGLAIAFVHGYAVTATSAKPIERLIDAPWQGETLAANSHFQQTLPLASAKPDHPGRTLMTLYENPETFLPLFQSLAKDPSLVFPLPPSALNLKPEQLKPISAINALFVVQPEGLRFQMNAYRKTPQPDAVRQSDPTVDRLLAHLPALTYATLVGNQLNHYWQTLTAKPESTPLLTGQITKLREALHTYAGLDLDRDLVSWMDGNYAVFTFPTRDTLLNLGNPNVNMGLGVVVQTSNPAAATAALQKLERSRPASLKGITVHHRRQANIIVTSWDAVQNGRSHSLFSYSWVEPNTLLMTAGTGAIASLLPQPKSALPASYTFMTATQSLPQPNQGYFYLNMGAVLSWAYSFVPQQDHTMYVQLFKQVMGSVHSVSATSTQFVDRDQLDALVVLAPSRPSHPRARLPQP